MLALNGADQLNGPRQWGSLLFCLVIVLSLQRAEGSTEETGSSYTKIRILPTALTKTNNPIALRITHPKSSQCHSPRNDSKLPNGWRRSSFHICGRLRERKKNLRDGSARSQVLTSVRPLLRPFSCRGPVWEFADRVQITATRSRRSVKNWLPDPVSHDCAPYFPFDPPTLPTPPARGRL